MSEVMDPSRADVLVAGGGAAALETVLALHERIDAGTHVTLLAPEKQFRYRPLAAYMGLVPDLRTTVDLVKLARDHGADFVRDRLEIVYPDRRQVQTRHGRRIAYEALVVAIGAVAVGPIPGAVTLGHPREESAFKALVNRVRTGGVDRLAIVVPTNLRWTLPAYEVALSLRQEARDPGMRIVVTTPEASPLEEFGPEIGDAIAALLDQRGVELLVRTFPTTLAEGHLWMPRTGTASVNAVVALARPAGPIVSGLPVDSLGFIPVDETGRVVGTVGIWAAGDATSHATKQGGFAVQQADVVASEVAATVGRPPSSVGDAHRPLVMRAVLLNGEHPLYLHAEQHGDGWHGGTSQEALWWPPAKIAGGRLAHYLAEQEGTAG